MRSKIIDRVFIYVLCVILLLTLGTSFQSSNTFSTSNSSYSSMSTFPSGLMLQIPLIQQPTAVPNPVVNPIPAIENPQVPQIPEQALEETQKPLEEAVTPEVKGTTYEVTAYYLNVRKNSYPKSGIINVVKQGDLLEVVQVMDNGWLRLKNGGYVHGGYAKIVSEPEQTLLVPTVNTTEIPVIPQSVDEVDGLDTVDDVEEQSESEPVKPTSTVKSDSGLTEDHISEIFEGTALANNELEEVILEIEEEYGINAYFTIAVMKLESGNGSSLLARKKNNLFGLNAIDGDKYNKAFSFKTKGDSIRKFGQLLSKNYVGKGYTTIEKVAKKYCPANSKWSGLVKTIMNRDYNKL